MAFLPIIFHGDACMTTQTTALLAIVLAIINAFVHSRDAYAVVPQGLVLSAIVVALLSLANILLALGARAK